MSLCQTSDLYASLRCPSPYVGWSHFRSQWFSVFSDFRCYLVSPPFCLYFYVVLVSMSLGLPSVVYGSLCCPSFYVTWSHLCCVWVSMLSEFLCHLVSLSFCMGLYVIQFSISLGLTSVLHRYLSCPSFCITCSHFRSVCISMLPEFLCRFVSLPFCVYFYVVRVSMSLGLPSVLYGSLCFRFSMSLGLTSVLYGYICYPIFYFTWPHFRSSWVSFLSEFLCHLFSFPFCMYLYVVRVSMSLGLTSVLFVLLCCPSFYVTWSPFSSVRVSMFSDFYVARSHFRSVCVSMLSGFL